MMMTKENKKKITEVINHLSEEIMLESCCIDDKIRLTDSLASLVEAVYSGEGIVVRGFVHKEEEE